MELTPRDTIAAIATAPGKGGVGIVRLSGPEAANIGGKLCRCTQIRPRYAHYTDFVDEAGEVLDAGIALYFAAPHSYTGEDVFELQAHGGPVVLNLLLKAAMDHGARLANPGEFTERAFLNDKLDLAQAEAVADLIESTTEESARAATRSLQGRFSETIFALLESLIQIRMYIEAALDFPEEEIDFLSDQQLTRRMQKLQKDMAAVRQSVRLGRLLREGMNVVILGRPNAGKSSLLNALSGNEAAIVTDIAGTTRDILQQQIHLDGLPLNVVDTAGVRETEDVVEVEGVKRAWSAVDDADRVLLLIDAQWGFDEEDARIARDLDKRGVDYDVVWNKMDLARETPIEFPEHHNLYLSAVRGDGVNDLAEHLRQCMGFERDTESLFTARQRHVDALDSAHQSIEAAAGQLEAGAGELAADELRVAQEELSRITGEFSADDLLGEIFSRFCIGK